MKHMPFEFYPCDLQDAKLIEPEVFEDERGHFKELYEKRSFKKAGIDSEFLQDNFSRSVQGVLRGLHYQKGQHSQGKLVRCVSGAILDVIVDLRRGSATFGRHEKFILSGNKARIIWVPRGFAHGFYTISESAEVHYKVDNEYKPEQESGIIWNDPTLNIDWPTKSPKLSEKDKNWMTLSEAKGDDDLFNS